ncbi:PA14 domain-containing protein [Haloarchaeobius sp. HME9146]|uniref:PA14 domain-containing protein n=1 Tax=Haloarchaeobius sp. HME9146 TaxID=2978732 RepID=UPI0021C1CA1F|nr:PA14 domain-containing protein [Haloarchaeobius sp. HME9146]MCT9098206.1 PA14 domain-containing protein [Haloarchaeobius sp. HME9146]
MGFSAKSVSAASSSSSQFTFYDDWEDGSYSSDPGWEVYRYEGDFNAQVVSRTTPDGGSKALQVRETTGGGTAGILGWGQRFDGWDGPWSLEGAFHTAAVPLNSTFQTHGVDLYTDSGVSDTPLRLSLGFRDSEGRSKDVSISGELIDTVESSQSVNWSENTWYRYEIEHDGTGGYSARMWEDGQSRPNEPTAESTGSAPGTEARGAGIMINGAKGRDFRIQHANIGWQRSDEGYFGRYYNLSENHPDMESSGSSLPDTGRVESTLPLSLTDRGEAAYQQFDWFDDSRLSKTEVDEQIDFGAEFFPIVNSLEGDPFHFAVHWTASVTVESEGTFSFATTSDDESWVFVDGDLVVDNGGKHGTRRRSGQKSLSPGTYDLDVFFAERQTSGSDMVLSVDDRLTPRVRRPEGGTSPGDPDGDLQALIGEKRGLIEDIRDVTRPILGDEASRVDEVAESLVDAIDPDASGSVSAAPQQQLEAMERLVAAEEVTKAAIGPTIGDGSIVRRIVKDLGALLKLISTELITRYTGGY